VTIVRSIFAVFLFAAGCRANPGAEADAPSRRANPEAASRPAGPAARSQRDVNWEEKPLGLQQSSVAVAQGPAPLLHLFDVETAVRVVDLTSGGTLVTLKVPGRTIVLVDERAGVRIGSETVLPGPLPKEHQYGIYADPQTPNTVRHGVGVPPQ
jgi:hypothetical protein